MQITLQNNNYNNNYGIKQTMPQNPSFKKAYPFKIILDGKPVKDEKIIENIFKNFRKILFNKVKRKTSQENFLISGLQSCYSHFDQNFRNLRIEGLKPSSGLRMSIVNGRPFAFSAGHAKKLEGIGHEIGRTKQTNSIDTYWQRQYYKTINEFANFWKTQNQDKREMTLFAFTNKNGKKTQPQITGIRFAKPEETQVTTKKPLQTDLFDSVA